MNRVADLKVKIFADGADYAGIVAMAKHPLIKGFTTNPLLMRKAGVRDYEVFAHRVLAAVRDRPVSFEVFADDFPGMIAQARTIAAWAPNVNVKIPVTDTAGRSTAAVLNALSRDGIALNVTAVFTHDQVRQVAAALDPEAPAIVSVFAGRIADTGIDPVPHMQMCKRLLRCRPYAQLLWASAREIFNVFDAESAGCDIITVPNDSLAKLDDMGRDLAAYSRETVQTFHDNAVTAGYHMRTAPAELPHIRREDVRYRESEFGHLVSDL